MKKIEFEKEVNESDFEYINKSDSYVCLTNLNITMKIVSNRFTDDRHTYLENPEDTEFCVLEYYYNSTFIFERYCIFTTFFNKPLYLPISHYYGVNGKLLKNLNEKTYFHFNRNEIIKLNQLLFSTYKFDGTNMLINSLENKNNVVLN